MNRREALLGLLGLPAATQIQRMPTAAVKPNDVIVLTVPGYLSADCVARLKAELEQLWPDHKVAILGAGMQIQVITEGPRS